MNALLVQGHANPCAIDARGRPPYFLASSDKNREAFRLARGTLGEDYCLWDDEAKVGPALTEEVIWQRQRRKSDDNVFVRRRRRRMKRPRRRRLPPNSEEEKKKQEEEAKRVQYETG